MTTPSLVATCHPKHHRIKRQIAYFHETNSHFAKVQIEGKENGSEIVDIVRSRYGSVAESDLSSRDKGVRAVAEAFGYANFHPLSCFRPFAFS